MWQWFHGMALLFSSTQKIWQDGKAKILALHQGKRKEKYLTKIKSQTLSSLAASPGMLCLGSVEKTNAKTEPLTGDKAVSSEKLALREGSFNRKGADVREKI